MIKKQDKALALLANKPVISIQLNETANIMRRKLGFDVPVIRVVINRISQECGSLQPITLTCICWVDAVPTQNLSLQYVGLRKAE